MPRRASSFYNYYWGKGPAGSPSFRGDINKIVPRHRKRTSVDDPKDVIFEAGLLWHGKEGDFLKGRHRDMFLVALYFTVLIDQGFHHYYPRLHPKFDRLTTPPKLGTTFLHVDPNFILQPDFGWARWTKARSQLFLQGQDVFREGLGEFSALHFPDLDVDTAWAKFMKHLPLDLWVTEL